MEALRVVTWNMFGRTPARAGLLGLVDDWDPHVLLLQEADGAAIEAEGRLGMALPHRYVRADAGYRPGMAILSLHPISHAGALDGPSRTFDRPRVLWCEIAPFDGAPIEVVSVHAAAPDSWLPPPYNPIRRNRQLAAIAAFAQGLGEGGGRVVMGGDFNTIRYAIPGMTDAAVALDAVRRTWRGLPIRGLPSLLRLDRIFVGPGLRPVAIVTGGPDHGSDHHPVMVTVTDAASPRVYAT